MKNQWEHMHPSIKRGLSIVAILLGLIVVVLLFSPATDNEGGDTYRQATIKHILTDTNTREVGLDSLAANVKRLSDRNEFLRREVERLRRDLESSRSNSTVAAIPSDVQSKLTQLRDDIARLREQQAKASVNLPTHFDTSNLQTKPTDASASFIQNPDTYFADAPLPDAVDDLTAGKQQLRVSDEGSASITIRVIEPESLPEADIVEPVTLPLYLPAGSILSGTLITGLDAPTHESARQAPFPALLRIQKDAILPNRFSADINECFLIVGGYGDLSSQRAYLRGETLSCVRGDGDVIETQLDAYAVGEDAKAGVRGRLVSKQGQLVAKSMMAGFLEGLAGAFDVNPVPSIQTSDASDTQLYQKVMSKGALQGAAMNGTGKALNRVAQFYLDMAENMFPVIEIDAARKIDIIVTRGTTLSLIK